MDEIKSIIERLVTCPFVAVVFRRFSCRPLVVLEEDLMLLSSSGVGCCNGGIIRDILES